MQITPMLFTICLTIYFSQAIVNTLKGGSVYIMLKLVNLHKISHLAYKAVAKTLIGKKKALIEVLKSYQD